MDKLCECGCGQLIVRRNRPARPNRFLFGHQGKGKPSPLRTTAESLLRRLQVLEPTTLPTGCWVYTGRKNEDGYGVVEVMGSQKFVHRFIYEAVKGPVPEGKELHHRCESKACANWGHLEPLTDQEHRQRRMGAHCKNGHPWTEENTKVNGRQRICKQCVKTYGAAYYQRNKERCLEAQRAYRAKRKSESP